MNTEQFIRDSAARGLSRRATMHALGMGPWKFRELLTLDVYKRQPMGTLTSIYRQQQSCIRAG